MAAPSSSPKKQISDYYDRLQIIFDSKKIDRRSTTHPRLRELWAFLETLNNRHSSRIAYHDEVKELSDTLRECGGLITLLEVQMGAGILSSNDEEIAQRAIFCSKNLERFTMADHTTSSNSHNQDPSTGTREEVIEQLIGEQGKLNTKNQHFIDRLNEAREEIRVLRIETARLEKTIADRDNTIIDLDRRELEMTDHVNELHAAIDEVPWIQSIRDPTQLHQQLPYYKYKLKSIRDACRGELTEEADDSDESSSTIRPPLAPDPPSAVRSSRPSTTRKTKDTKKGKEPAKKSSDARQTPYEYRSQSPASTITSQASKINTGKTGKMGGSSGSKKSRPRR